MFLSLAADFIGQGGDWEDDPSQKTHVVSGVLCVVLLVDNVDIYLSLLLGSSTGRDVLTSSTEGNFNHTFYIHITCFGTI